MKVTAFKTAALASALTTEPTGDFNEYAIFRSWSLSGNSLNNDLRFGSSKPSNNLIVSSIRRVSAKLTTEGVNESPRIIP